MAACRSLVYSIADTPPLTLTISVYTHASASTAKQDASDAVRSTSIYSVICSRSRRQVRDGQGRKMSKSLGNVVDPVDTIAEYGTDALRYTLATGALPGCSDARHCGMLLAMTLGPVHICVRLCEVCSFHCVQASCGLVILGSAIGCARSDTMRKSQVWRHAFMRTC